MGKSIQKRIAACAISCSVLSTALLPTIPIMAKEVTYGNDEGIQIVNNNDKTDGVYEHKYNISYDNPNGIIAENGSRICINLSDVFSITSIHVPVWENNGSITVVGYKDESKSEQLFSIQPEDNDIDMQEYPDAYYIEIITDDNSLNFKDLSIDGISNKEIVSNTFTYEYQTNDEDGNEVWNEVAKENTGGYEMDKPDLSTTTDLFPYDTEDMDVTLSNLHVYGDGDLGSCEYIVSLPDGYGLKRLKVQNPDAFVDGNAEMYVDDARMDFTDSGSAKPDGKSHSTIRIAINNEDAFDIGQIIMSLDTNGQKSDKAISVKGSASCAENDNVFSISDSLNIKFDEKQEDPDPTPDPEPDPEPEPDLPVIMPDPEPEPTPTPTPGTIPEIITLPDKNPKPTTAQPGNNEIVPIDDIINPARIITPNVVDNTGLGLDSLLATKITTNPSVSLANIISNPSTGLSSVIQNKVQTTDVIDLTTGGSVSYGASLSDMGIDSDTSYNSEGDDTSAIDETTKKITDENNKKQKQEDAKNKIKPQMVIIPIAVIAAVALIALAFRKQKNSGEDDA